MVDFYSLLLTSRVLREYRDNLVSYLDKVGIPKQNPPSWRPPNISMPPVVANFLNMSHHGDEAEMCLYNIPYGPLVQWTDFSKAVVPQAIALLRSSRVTQQQLLKGLYE